MTASQNILILTSDTGGGHRSAATALEHSFNAVNPGQVVVNITQVLEEAHVLTRRFAALYNYLLRHHQGAMKYYYWYIEKFRLNESPFIFRGALRYGRRLFEKFCPTAIVSVHPMTHHFYAYMLKKLGLLGKIPLFAVVTDPVRGFWRSWACHDVDRYFVASEEAKQQLSEYGIEPERIHILGMPVHRRFHPVTETEQRQIRESMGLDPDKFTVCFNAGWIGGGNIPKIMEQLLPAALDIQVLFLTGHNSQLLEQAEKWTEIARFPFYPMGYTDQMPKIMNASDVMVTKMGGLTTFEALASQLPIIADVVTPPMPQEMATADFIEREGAGILLCNPGDIISVVQSLMNDENRRVAIREASLRCGMPGASDRIAEAILQQIR